MKFRYDGPADVLYRNSDDTTGVKKGTIAEFSQAFVDSMTKNRRGNTEHRFTPVDDLNKREVAAAEQVKETAVHEERTVTGVKAEAERRDK